MDYRDNTQLHDAELQAIHVNRETGIARLDFQYDVGENITVHLKGLKKIRCEDFTMQNVVCNFLRSSVEDLTSKDYVYWVNWVCSLSDAPQWTPEHVRKALLVACQQRSLELIILIPSAGAQLAAICEESQIEWL